MTGADYRQVPVFINVRDRYLDLIRLVAWLEDAGHERIILLDNASTFEPCVEYLNSTPHRVVTLGQNLGKLALWRSGIAPVDRPFVLTDPDVVPVNVCPHDAVGVMLEAIARFDRPKAGFGLWLDDVPEGMRSLGWERSLVAPERRLPRRSAHDYTAFDSLIDTTFAVYDPLAEFGLPAVRLGYPYQARHMPWYPATSEAERVEREFYLEHALPGSEFSSWKEGVQV